MFGDAWIYAFKEKLIKSNEAAIECNFAIFRIAFGCFYKNLKNNAYNSYLLDVIGLIYIIL